MTQDKARVIVVDDEEASRYALVRPLSNAGYEVLEAHCGKDALALATTTKPELVVLDVRLPDMLGFDVAEELRARPETRSVAILQISASYSSADAQAYGLQHGADAYLVQPVESQVIVATVGALLRMRQAEQFAWRERARAEQARKSAEQERARAEESERRHRFLADMVPQLVWSCNVHGVPDYFNQRWFEFSGESEYAEEWTESLHPEDKERFVAAWEQSLRTGEPFEIECRRWSPPANAFRWLLIRGMPMRNPLGEITRWYGTSTIIDSQKQALEERERLLADARQLANERERLVQQLRDESQRKNEFIAMLSHELRNPLGPVQYSLHVLERAPAGSEQAKHAREVISRQTKHISRLVDDLLDITRIARGKIAICRDHINLNRLIRGILDDHQPLFAKAGLQLDVDLSDSPLSLYGDAARITQAVGNILRNAIKFTPAPGHVSVSLSFDGDGCAALRVSDNGQGMNPETLAHLFEPFVQGANTLDRTTGGLGLGLALAKGMIELHGGTVTAASEGIGKGSTFTVVLPVEAKKALSVRPSALHIEESNVQRRVLIIEDLQDAAAVLKDLLALSGHVVEIAHDARSGIAIAHEFEPDIVLCDIGLPGVDGYEVARQLRADPKFRSTCLVALSGYALHEDIERAKTAGFDRHVAKPPQLPELEQLIRGVPHSGIRH